MGYFQDVGKKVKRTFTNDNSNAPAPAVQQFGNPAQNQQFGAKVEEQRGMIDNRLGELRNLYAQPDANTLWGQIQARASGQHVPYSPEVLNAMYADNADASAGMVASQSEMMRRAMANAGLGGSGLELSGQMNINRQANKATRAGRRKITSTGTLRNFQSQERAQQQAQNYLAAKNQSAMTAGLAEIDYRSKMSETTSTNPNVNPQEQARIADLRKQYSGANPYEKWLGAAGGSGQPYNMSMGTLSVASPNLGYRAPMDPARRASLERQAADWNAQRNQFFAQHGYA